MNELKKYSSINEDNIDYSNFTLSLLSQATTQSIISAQKLQDIQLQIMNLLKNNITKFTRGESCSVKTEVAESLLHSILYNVDFFLIDINDIEICIDLLKKNSISDLYTKGLSSINNAAKKSRGLLNHIQSTKLNVQMDAYHATIDTGLSEFFDNYNAEFFSDESPGSIDYPLSFDNMSLKGIMYIRQYIENLYFENTFCKLFPINNINILLQNYGKIYKYNHKEMLINIFELVFNNSVFSIMLGKDPKNLSISKEECLLLKTMLIPNISEVIESSIEELIIKLYISDKALLNYLKKYANKFCVSLKQNVSEGNIESLVIVGKDDPLSISYAGENPRLNDDSFKRIANEILSSGTTESKAEIIKTDIHNLEDLVEILSADCIFDNEYKTIFNLLTNFELAFILHKISGNSSYNNSIDHIVDTLHLSSSEADWQIKFIDYLKSLSQHRLSNIIGISDNIAP